MDISKIPPKLKREHKKSDYLKAFISPLKWCPAFGYVPSIEDIRDNLKIDDATEETIQQCLGIIESARSNLGAYDTNMVKYARLPDPKELIFIYHEYPCAAVRKLFKHLDYLALRVAADYMPSFADRIFTQLSKPIKEIPPKPIGRMTNRWDDGLSYIVRQIRIDSFLPEFLLREVKKITGNDIEINYAQLLSLYAILEAWLILTSLVFKTYQKEMNELPYIKENLIYAEKLLELSDMQFLLNEKQNIQTELLTVKEKKKAGMKINRKDREKLKGILLAINDIKKKLPRPKRNVEGLYEYIFQKYLIDDDLINRLCDGEDIGDCFYETQDKDRNIYHIFMVKDNLYPEDYKKASLFQIKNTEQENMESIKFNTYRSEYFYDRKPK